MTVLQYFKLRLKIYDLRTNFIISAKDIFNMGALTV